MPLRRPGFDTHDVDPEDFGPFDTPDTENVLDAEEEPYTIRPVPVYVEGSVRIDQPGNRDGGLFTVQVPLVSNGRAVKLLNGDARRETATIVALDSDLYLGREPGDVINTPGACRWPVGVPLVYRLSDELWASAVTGATVVSVIVEQWAR